MHKIPRGILQQEKMRLGRENKLSKIPKPTPCAECRRHYAILKLVVQLQTVPQIAVYYANYKLFSKV